MTKKQEVAKTLITCPTCGHTQYIAIPDDRCLASYQCDVCGTTHAPQGTDCCVLCSYAEEKCPAKAGK